MEKKSALKLTTKMHTGYGIISFILGILTVLCFLWAVFASALENREIRGTAIKIGIIEIVAALMSFAGISFGFMGELTKETYKIFAHLGLIINIVAIFFHIAVLIYAY